MKERSFRYWNACKKSSLSNALKRKLSAFVSLIRYATNGLIVLTLLSILFDAFGNDGTETLPYDAGKNWDTVLSPLQIVTCF